MLTSNKSGRLRIGRVSQAEDVYLLTAVVNRREPIFDDWRLGRLVVRQFREAHKDRTQPSYTYLMAASHQTLMSSVPKRVSLHTRTVFTNGVTLFCLLGALSKARLMVALQIEGYDHGSVWLSCVRMMRSRRPGASATCLATATAPAQGACDGLFGNHP